MKVAMPSWEQARVMVVGDVMLDRYWYGGTSRISPEAPVPVVHVRENEERVGGAGNVALNIAALGAGVTVLGQVGEDEAAQAVSRLLANAGVINALSVNQHSPTITKLRVVSRQQQLIRLDFEDVDIDTPIEPLLAKLDSNLANADVVVLSDYGKGVLRNPRLFIERARTAGKAVLIDPKTKDFSLYRGASLVTPNLGEFEAVVGRCADEADLVSKALELINRHDIEALLITRGEHGMSLVRPGVEALHLPAQAREVFDVTGAGDTVIAVIAAALSAGSDLAEAVSLSNIAAGIVVGKLGTATVSVSELRRALHELHEFKFDIVPEDELVTLVVDAKERGETVVMTNGCFDILHAGHVQYLEEARKLGDRLIVAVNDDASVRKLKGEGRPINSLEQRMAVMAALKSVDWVVPFSEDTPERLICRVKPNVLVKGGDYRPEQIAGGPCVQADGGKVVVLSFKDGCSTSSIIEKIKRN